MGQITILQKPQTIVANLAIVYNAWQTVAASVLIANSAAFAYISAFAFVEDNKSTFSEVNLFFRETGSALLNDDTTKRTAAVTLVNDPTAVSPPTHAGSNTNAFWLTLDSNNEFDYFAETIGTPSVNIAHLELLGYSQ